jgi:hypothetical protein
MRSEQEIKNRLEECVNFIELEKSDGVFHTWAKTEKELMEWMLDGNSAPDCSKCGKTIWDRNHEIMREALKNIVRDTEDEHTRISAAVALEYVSQPPDDNGGLIERIMSDVEYVVDIHVESHNEDNVRERIREILNKHLPSPPKEGE